MFNWLINGENINFKSSENKLNSPLSRSEISSTKSLDFVEVCGRLMNQSQWHLEYYLKIVGEIDSKPNAHEIENKEMTWKV